jgi:DNA replication regulator DPB11
VDTDAVYFQMQSRTASKEVLQDPPVTALRRPSQPVPERFESFDTPTVMTGDIDLTEQSMRVTYEDPGERDEKKRLMSLFERPVEEAEPLGKADGRKKGKGLVRRSLRVAGF